MTIVLAYPVTRERTFTADIESTARRMAVMGRMVLQRFLAGPSAPSLPDARKAPAVGHLAPVLLSSAARQGVGGERASEVAASNFVATSFTRKSPLLRSLCAFGHVERMSIHG